jgi:putative intracellular protease/amidase
MPRVLLGIVTFLLAVLTLVGIVAAGAIRTSRAMHPSNHAPTGEYGRSTLHTEPVGQDEPASTQQHHRIVVAFVLGAAGTVPSDLLAPYDIFASSPAFRTYVVAQSSRPAPLEGGPSLVPMYTFADVEAHPGLRPDVVVVPALTTPDGPTEAPLRGWVTRQHDTGARVLGVCSGSLVLAATGMLDGLHATSHWSRIGALEASHPDVHWVRGQRYVEDGSVTTTAAVSSGVPAALHLVAELVGPGEAQRIADQHRELGWSPALGTKIAKDHFALRDWPVGLNWVMPWFRPILGIYLRDGVDELDATAAFEVYGQSAAARTVALATSGTVRTRHGIVLLTTGLSDAPHLARVVVPDAGASGASGAPAAHGVLDPQVHRWAQDRGIRPELWTGGGAHSDGMSGSGFAAALQDLADHTDTATAKSTAKMIGYPVEGLDLDSPHRAWRTSLLTAVALALAILVAMTPARLIRRRRLRTTTARIPDQQPPMTQESRFVSARDN